MSDVDGIAYDGPPGVPHRPDPTEPDDERPDGYDRERPGPITCTCQLDPGACPDHEPAE